MTLSRPFNLTTINLNFKEQTTQSLMIIQTAMSIELYLVFSSLCFSTGSLVYSLRKETVPDCYRLCIKKNQVQNGSKCNETSTDGFKDLCGTGMISFINAHCKKLCSTSTRHIQNDTTVRGKSSIIILYDLIEFSDFMFHTDAYHFIVN